MKTFSIRGAITFGWETFKKRPWLLVGATVIIALVQMAMQLIGSIPVIGLVTLVLGLYVAMGITRFALRAHDSVETVEIGSLVALHPFWRYVGAVVLKGLIAGGPLLIAAFVAGLMGAMVRANPQDMPDISPVGIVLLAFAGVWLVIASMYLMFAEYLVMDKDQKPVQAVKESYRIVQGNWWKLLGFVLVLGVINVLGAIALLVGLLVTVPVSMLAFIHVYRSLEHGASEVAPMSAHTPMTTPTPNSTTIN